MKKEIGYSNDFPVELLQLKEGLGGTISKKNGSYILDIDTHYGVGSVKFISFKEGITVMDFDITLTEDFIFKLGEQDTNLLYFTYCTEGACYFKSETNEKYNRIEELRTGIMSCNTDVNNQINIKKDSRLVLNLMSINKDTYFNRFTDNDLNQTKAFENLFKSFDSLNSYLYQCSFNLKIAEELRVINQFDNDDSISSILITESSYQTILALHLDHFYKEINEDRIIATLTKSELQKIRQITDYIVESPEIQHSISSLCSQITMSPAKLQEGFKGMHDTTVADFVRNVRIEKAERLLNETDLNISEIVYTIGLTSRSYFCKIFKKKYDCSPKRYRKTIRAKVINTIDS